MNRRVHLIRAMLLVLVMGMVASPVSLAAQEATPEESLLDDLGLPTLEVTVSADGIEAPADVAAGPVLLVVDNQTDGFLLVDVVQLPEGVDVDAFLALGDNEDGSLPDWVGEAVAAGSAAAMPGGAGGIVLNLAAGEWTLIADAEVDLAATSAPLSVTGDPPASTEIAADLDLELGEYVFTFPETLEAGPQIWHVTNTHAVPHHAVIFPVDRQYTVEEVTGGMMGYFMGTPVADGFSPETSIVGPPVEVPVISAGQEIWLEANLMPGHYAALCFISDPGSDVPHLMQGMVSTFEVTAP